VEGQLYQRDRKKFRDLHMLDNTPARMKKVEVIIAQIDEQESEISCGEKITTNGTLTRFHPITGNVSMISIAIVTDLIRYEFSVWRCLNLLGINRDRIAVSKASDFPAVGRVISHGNFARSCHPRDVLLPVVNS
jgi:hypothetical protein